MSITGFRHRIAAIEKALPPRRKPTPFMAALFQMISIIYDDTIDRLEKRRRLDALEVPEPTTKADREFGERMERAYPLTEERLAEIEDEREEVRIEDERRRLLGSTPTTNSSSE